jgi:alkanesulfonate monooxygenase SsuD/methylene tetrahydromethanopterin reductase-like flavin-dependent oxidoreductase (luciferase family)
MTDPATRPAPCFGVVARAEGTSWPAMLDVAQRVDALGFHSLWTNDHLLPINSALEDASFEGWTILSAWASATRSVRLGLLVASNTFRAPGLLAKMAVTLDHVSGGRAILGIGSGWNEAEHAAYGLPFGDSPGERLRWLEDALRVLREMMVGGQPTGHGQYPVDRPPNRPLPIQPRLPILVGGSGERVTLRLVATYADACNLSVAQGLDGLRHKLEVLEAHCATLGRDPAEIERTVEFSSTVIRDTRSAAVARHEAVGGHRWSGPEPGPGVTTPDELVPYLRSLWQLGFDHYLFGMNAPYDEETVERLAREIRPAFEAATRVSPGTA